MVCRRWGRLGVTLHSLHMMVVHLRLLKTVSSTFQDLDFDVSLYHSLSIDAAIMASKNCPNIGKHVGILFVTQ